MSDNTEKKLALFGNVHMIYKPGVLTGSIPVFLHVITHAGFIRITHWSGVSIFISSDPSGRDQTAGGHTERDLRHMILQLSEKFCKSEGEVRIKTWDAADGIFLELLQAINDALKKAVKKKPPNDDTDNDDNTGADPDDNNDNDDTGDPPDTQEIKISKTLMVYCDEEDFQPTYTVDGKPATFSNGTLSFDTIKPGNHNVVITSGNVDSDGNKKYLDVNASFTYSVTEAAVAFDGEKLVATGSDLTVSDYVSSITKVNVDGKDYSAKGRGAVTVINEDGTIDLSKTESAEKTGSVSLTVTAAGYPELSFATNDLQYASIPAIAAKTYTGKAFTPDVTAKYADKELVKDTDYTITYANNKNAGTAKVTITGIGSYTGTKTVTFRINKAKQPMTAKAAVKSVKFKAVKKKALTVKPITVKKAQGTVSYKKAGGDKKLTINARSGKVTVKKGASKGLHKITVKIKAKGNRNYKAGTKTVTVKVRVR